MSVINIRKRDARFRSVPGWRGLRVGLAASMLMLLGFASAMHAAEDECKEHTEDNRECTVVEELGHCLTETYERMEDCWETSGYLGRISCVLAGDIEMAACYLGILKSIKEAVI